jgi:hypothetical protein
MIVCTALTALVGCVTENARAQGACDPAFEQIAGSLAAVVGQCQGNALVLSDTTIQRTENGVLVLRRADAVVAFMDQDGRSIWLEGWAGPERHESAAPAASEPVIRGVSLSLSPPAVPVIDPSLDQFRELQASGCDPIATWFVLASEEGAAPVESSYQVTC